MLTERQNEAVNLINDFIGRNGYPPSIREFSEMMHLKSTSSSHRYLQTLKKKGYINFKENSSRTITVLKVPKPERS